MQSAYQESALIFYQITIILKQGAHIMTTPEITTLEELLAVSKNSPIGLIIESLISPNLAPADQEPLTEKDIPVGTLTQTEKALQNALSNLRNSAPEFIIKLDEISQEIEVIDHHSEDAIALRKEMDKLRKKITYASELIKDLNKLYWSFIRQRLYAEGITDILSLGIKSVDTIVIPEKTDDKKSGQTLTIRIGF